MSSTGGENSAEHSRFLHARAAWPSEKKSSGFPEVDPTRPTSKVNFAIIVAVGLFYILTFALVFYMTERNDEPETNLPSPPAQHGRGGK